MSRALIHGNIYLLPVIVLFIIHLDIKESLPRNTEKRFFLVLVWQTIIMMALETCSWIPEEMTGRGAEILVWVINICYMSMLSVFAYTWFVYIYSRIPGKETLVEDKRKLFLMSAPVFLHLAVVFLTFWTHWVFYVNDENTYARGHFFIIPYLFAGFYMIAAAAFAGWRQRWLTRADEKRECALLAVCAVIPIGGLVLQLVDYTNWTVWPFNALSILIIYIGMQNGQITTDGLTGLNNRGQLDKHLAARCDADDGEAWCLMILDVDDFKGINDKYGHIAGDKALCRVAEILKTLYGHTDAFLSRFGGDEFAVVISCGSAGGEECMVQTFYKALEESNHTSEAPYKLSLSVGCACYDGKQVNDRHSLMLAADEAMYREKQRRKARKSLPAG